MVRCGSMVVQFSDIKRNGEGGLSEKEQEEREHSMEVQGTTKRKMKLPRSTRGDSIEKKEWAIASAGVFTLSEGHLKEGRR